MSASISNLKDLDMETVYAYVTRGALNIQWLVNGGKHTDVFLVQPLILLIQFCLDRIISCICEICFLPLSMVERSKPWKTILDCSIVCYTIYLKMKQTKKKHLHFHQMKYRLSGTFLGCLLWESLNVYFLKAVIKSESQRVYIGEFVLFAVYLLLFYLLRSPSVWFWKFFILLSE